MSDVVSLASDVVLDVTVLFGYTCLASPTAVYVFSIVEGRTEGEGRIGLQTSSPKEGTVLHVR